VARDGILYVGVWGSKELVVCDVKNPRQPKIIARAPHPGVLDEHYLFLGLVVDRLFSRCLSPALHYVQVPGNDYLLQLPPCLGALTGCTWLFAGLLVIEDLEPVRIDGQVALLGHHVSHEDYRALFVHCHHPIARDPYGL